MRNPLPILKESWFPISKEKTACNPCPFELTEERLRTGQSVKGHEDNVQATTSQKRIHALCPTLKSDFPSLTLSHLKKREEGTKAGLFGP